MGRRKGETWLFAVRLSWGLLSLALAPSMIVAQVAPSKTPAVAVDVAHPFEPRLDADRVDDIRTLRDTDPKRAARLLSSPYPAVRDAAARAWLDLRAAGPDARFTTGLIRPSVDSLLRDLTSRDISTRSKAVAWLRLVRPRREEGLTTRANTARLLAALEDERAAVRAGAALGLADTGVADGAVAAALLRVAEDPAASVRTAALEALIGFEMPSAAVAAQRRAALWRALDGSDIGAAVQAVFGLSADQRAVELLARRAMHDGRSAVERAIYRRLARRLSPAAGERATAHRDPGFRAAGLAALDDRHPRAGAIAARALHDDDPIVRWRAIDLLARLSPLGADRIAALGEATTDPDAGVRHAALTLLARLNEPLDPVVDAIADALAHDDGETRRRAVIAAAHAGPHPTLVKAINRAIRCDDDIAGSLVTSVAAWGPDGHATTAALIARLEGTPSRVERASLIRALTRIGTPATGPLVAALRDADEGPHQALIDVLVAIGPPAARALADALPQMRGRQRLLAALGQLGPDAASVAGDVAIHLEAIDPDTRLAAAMALGEIGPSAIPDVALEWRAARRRDAATWALLRIAEQHGEAAAPAQPVFIELLFDANPVRAARGADGLHLSADEPAAPLFALAKRRTERRSSERPEEGRGERSDRKTPSKEREITRLIDDVLARRDAVTTQTIDRAASLLGDGNIVHRTVAALSLAVIGEPAVPALGRALASEDPARRRAAARALGQIARDDAAAVVQAIDQAYGIRVILRGRPYDLPRSLWTTARVRPLQRERQGVALAQLAIALAAYSPSMPRAHADTVYLIRDLVINRLRYGGTFYESAVYVAAGAEPNHFVQEAFHHEFSSLLLAHHPLPSEWSACNAPGHRYGSGGRDAIRQGLTGWGSTNLFREGFFKPYATADAENDFNVFSETMLAHPELARKLIERYPRLAAKWQVWIDYYRAIDPKFGIGNRSGLPSLR